MLFTALALAVPATACEGNQYEDAVCLYRQGHLDRAAAIFERIVRTDERDPRTLKALYFLARVDMKQGRCQEAEKRLIRLYQLSPAFYGEWSCDFLLGVCRKARGVD